MAKLPKSIIKKYGISKKAWAVFRGQSKNSRSIKRTTNKMKKRTKTSKKGSSINPAMVLIGGGLYGAGRAKISNALAPITAKIPLGNISDEAVLFALSWYANKKIKNKYARAVTFAAMSVEAARMGEALIEGSFFPSSSGASSNFEATTF